MSHAIARSTGRFVESATMKATIKAAVFLLFATQIAMTAEVPVRSDKPNEITFPSEETRFVRFVILATNSGEACVDELEVYAPDAPSNLALASTGAKATASSCIAGHAIHQIQHLNDGQYGNAHSWIAAGTGEQWAQIELPQPAQISRVVFSRDRRREYADRMPIAFEVRLSVDGKDWKTARKVTTTAAPVNLRQTSGAGPQVPAPPPPPGADAMGDRRAEVPLRDEKELANLALNAKAKASASSLLPGYPIHQVKHLNDGLGGNDYSWVSKGEPSWAEIDLGGVYWVCKVAFASDKLGRHNDRAATAFSILSSTEYNEATGSATWKACAKQEGGEPVLTRREFRFEPVQARWVRIAVEATNSSEVRIDEIEVYGQSTPIPPEKVGPMPVAAEPGSADRQQLRYAFLAEEHAWLKTYGRADISSRLVPYNGRVKEYPHHVGDDRLPLPPLRSEPTLDGKLDDTCWQEASRGVVRVAHPYDFDTGPLIEHVVTAGWRGEHLYLAVRTDRLLSRHVAVISGADWAGCGVVVYTDSGLRFDIYDDGKVTKSMRPESGFDPALRCFEFRLPLSLFADCREGGLRIGLGMGGKHTAYAGRPVDFVFSSLAIADQGLRDGAFRVRLAATGDVETRIQGNARDLEKGLTLRPGESKTIAVPAMTGAIGPEFDLQIQEENQPDAYALHLFRYDPLERTLTLMTELVDRLSAKGLDVRAEREELAGFRDRHKKLLSAETPDRKADREVFFAARTAKRKLLFRDPDLDPIEKILFVKRWPYEPSHNYSVLLDSPYRGGGAVCILETPRRDGRLDPGAATVRQLFDAKDGIARDPMATFDLSRIYFGYRPSEKGYFHVMQMNPDGSGVKQLTDGPFHDYWPCPLPDGDLAFISTRCKARYLCWRPQVSVLFRMSPDGQNVRPLSFSNLSEWAPSVMNDGRIIWTRSEYIDKGADFGHTLWSVRPDGSMPELIFGNTIIQPNGYANGREMPGTREICCILISHFGDLNGPIALLDIDQGRFNPKAIKSITPEVPWPGMWPNEECFRDPVPVARDYVLCSHAPLDRFGIYTLDRFGNRELLHLDSAISSMCPTIFRAQTAPPVLVEGSTPQSDRAEVVLVDVHEGLAPAVERGRVKYIRVVEEVRSDLERLSDGSYRRDHDPFMHFYAAPVDVVSGPSGWPSYVAKAPWGIVPVADDGSARFHVPAGKVLYFQALDKDFNELQRMRSVVQFQPGEKRSCIGCHEPRQMAPPAAGRPMAAAAIAGPRELIPPTWGTGPFSYEQVVQPVLDARCVRCHDRNDKQKIDLSGTLDRDRIPASYRTLVSQGWVHFLDCGWNSGGCEKAQPLTFGTVKSRLWKVLDAGHYDVRLTTDEMVRIKTWIDLNCPLWPDYIQRENRPLVAKQMTRAD